MSGKLARIAAAMDYLSRAFQEAGLSSPEVVVNAEDLATMRAMTESLQFMYDPRATGENKIAGIVVRAKCRDGY